MLRSADSDADVDSLGCILGSGVARRRLALSRGCVAGGNFVILTASILWPDCSLAGTELSRTTERMVLLKGFPRPMGRCREAGRSGNLFVLDTVPISSGSMICELRTCC